MLYISGSACRLYSFNEHRIELIKSRKVSLQKHHKKGGQSQNRIQRLADESHFNYISNALASLDEVLVSNGIAKVKTLVIAGPAAKKEDLVKRLSGPLKRVLAGVVTTSDRIGDADLKELALEQVYAEDIKRDRKIEQKIYDTIARCDERVDLLCFGFDNVIQEAGECLLKRIIVDSHLINSGRFNPELISGNCEVIILKFATEGFLLNYDGIIGVRYF